MTRDWVSLKLQRVDGKIPLFVFFFSQRPRKFRSLGSHPQQMCVYLVVGHNVILTLIWLRTFYASQHFNERLATSELNQEAKASLFFFAPDVEAPAPPYKAGVGLPRP